MSKFTKFPSIGGFHNVRKWAKTRYTLPVRYKGKIKLHGTNAGVRIDTDGTVTAQKRTSDVKVGDDNYGWASFVSENEWFFKAMGNSDHSIIVFGEWCGKGVQKSVALSELDSKYFAIFAVLMDNQYIVDPAHISAMLPSEHKYVKVLPWFTKRVFDIKYFDAEHMVKIVDRLNAEIDDVEACDPWVKENFGIEGVGEGVVYYPVDFLFREPDNGPSFGDLTFKAKGEKHSVNKSKRPVAPDPAVVGAAEAFAEMFATPARCEQAVSELGINFDEPSVMKRMGEFLKWIGQDVQKESVDELEASGLEWKQVAKTTTAHARTWYLVEANK